MITEITPPHLRCKVGFTCPGAFLLPNGVHVAIGKRANMASLPGDLHAIVLDRDMAKAFLVKEEATGDTQGGD